MLLLVHVMAGGLAIILGAVALVALKGGALHRRSGLLFVYAVLIMGVGGAILQARHSLTSVNVLAGFMSAYLVITALTTVRPLSAWTRRLNAAGLVVAIACSFGGGALGLKAFASPGRTIDGVPFFMPFVFAIITTLAAVSDIRLMRSGALQGRARLARHLRRMCFALFIAVVSFFSIRERVAKVLPYPFTTTALRALPTILVLVAMFYWLWRLRHHSSVSIDTASVLRESPDVKVSPHEGRRA
jgi:hypothetical protein